MGYFLKDSHKNVGKISWIFSEPDKNVARVVLLQDYRKERASITTTRV